MRKSLATVARNLNAKNELDSASKQNQVASGIRQSTTPQGGSGQVSTKTRRVVDDTIITKNTPVIVVSGQKSFRQVLSDSSEDDTLDFEKQFHTSKRARIDYLDSKVLANVPERTRDLSNSQKMAGDGISTTGTEKRHVLLTAGDEKQKNKRKSVRSQVFEVVPNGPVQQPPSNQSNGLDADQMMVEELDLQDMWNFVSNIPDGPSVSTASQPHLTVNGPPNVSQYTPDSRNASHVQTNGIFNNSTSSVPGSSGYAVSQSKSEKSMLNSFTQAFSFQQPLRLLYPTNNSDKKAQLTSHLDSQPQLQFNVREDRATVLPKEERPLGKYIQQTQLSPQFKCIFPTMYNALPSQPKVSFPKQETHSLVGTAAASNQSVSPRAIGPVNAPPTPSRRKISSPNIPSEVISVDQSASVNSSDRFVKEIQREINEKNRRSMIFSPRRNSVPPQVFGVGTQMIHIDTTKSSCSKYQLLRLIMFLAAGIFLLCGILSLVRMINGEDVMAIHHDFLDYLNAARNAVDCRDTSYLQLGKETIGDNSLALIQNIPVDDEQWESLAWVPSERVYDWAKKQYGVSCVNGNCTADPRSPVTLTMFYNNQSVSEGVWRNIVDAAMVQIPVSYVVETAESAPAKYFGISPFGATYPFFCGTKIYALWFAQSMKSLVIRSPAIVATFTSPFLLIFLWKFWKQYSQRRLIRKMHSMAIRILKNNFANNSNMLTWGSLRDLVFLTHFGEKYAQKVPNYLDLWEVVRSSLSMEENISVIPVSNAELHDELSMVQWSQRRKYD